MTLQTEKEIECWNIMESHWGFLSEEVAWFYLSLKSFWWLVTEQMHWEGYYTCIGRRSYWFALGCWDGNRHNGTGIGYTGEVELQNLLMD